MKPEELSAALRTKLLDRPDFIARFGLESAVVARELADHCVHAVQQQQEFAEFLTELAGCENEPVTQGELGLWLISAGAHELTEADKREVTRALDGD
jgi:hypothetical protein